MCSPISVATGGATGGCTGICRFIPQIIASLSVVGILMLNFKGLLLKALQFNWMPFIRKTA
ncbi:MAG: hypothetical protein JRI95_16955 [Deltaproteobacteria bacterium]|nr:hypothetical protein [Deltaproteobacteria bacterium]